MELHRLSTRSWAITLAWRHQRWSLHRSFEDKVAGVRSATADAPPPSFSTISADISFRQFQSVTVDDVIATVRALPDKSCALDPLSTAQLKAVVDIIAPFMVELFNRSLSSGSVPVAFKSAYITPRLKKSDMDPADVRSYRPISNLSVLSKLLERLVARQLLAHLNKFGLLPRLQSAYRACHSLNRDRRVEGPFWHVAGYWRWWSICTRAAWSFCGLRHYGAP